jgi:hypothetical protein
MTPDLNTAPEFPFVDTSNSTSADLQRLSDQLLLTAGFAYQHDLAIPYVHEAILGERNQHGYELVADYRMGTACGSGGSVLRATQTGSERRSRKRVSSPRCLRCHSDLLYQAMVS